MTFKPYPKYKASGVEWLGDVPADWAVSKLGFEAWVRARLGWKGLKADEYVENGFAFLATPNIKGKVIDFENVNFIDALRYDESPEIKLRLDDVLLAKDGSTLGTVNVVRSLPRPTTVNSSIAVISTSDSLSGIYLYYLFCSSYMAHLIQRAKGGMGVPHLFQSDLNKFSLPVPPLSQQLEIGACLDRETAKIDTLIAKQETIIDLLKEKRQAVISHAVTKGLDPNTPMKASGVEWLGDVPEHWALPKISYLGRVQNGSTPDRSKPEFWGGNLPWLASGKVNDIIVESADEFITEMGLKASSLSLFPSGTVLVGLVGQGRTRGMTALLKFPSYINQNMAGIIVEPSTNATYLLHVLSAGYEPLRDFGRGGQQDALNCGILGAFRVPMPPTDEQVFIVEYLAAALNQFDTLIAKAQQAIVLQKEHRTALISAAVTGKIDVRSEIENLKAE